MDRIDQEILKVLRKNPEMSFLAVARKVGLSSLTVQKRYEEMRKKKAFLGTTLMIDLSKIGLKGKAFLFITVSKDSNLREIVETFRQMPNLFLVVEVVGTFDLLAMVVFRDITDIMKVVDEVKVVPYVEKVEIALTNESFYPFREEYTEIIPFKEDTAEDL
ncbi:MAG: hypothetical protein CW716_12250 [Candidatus Bathyarchaeum sp.]|nr:MAG: hypothetical protein CW716_12250 [Candidatus Bathyarchaeum sp.]